MIVATTTVSNIDYEACFAAVLPKMLHKMKNVQNPGFAVRFLQKMGDDSAPILTEILSGMKRQEKNALLVWAGDLLRERICTTLNAALAGHSVGKAIRIGSIDVRSAQTGCGITLIAEDVTLDCKALVSAVGGGAGGLLSAVVGALPAKAEEQGCRLLNLPAVNEKLRGLMADWLKKNGLVMTVEEVVVSPAADSAQTGSAEKPAGKGELPDELEESLLNAMVKYLKNTHGNAESDSAKKKKMPKPVLV